jgi:hypothetical protein
MFGVAGVRGSMSTTSYSRRNLVAYLSLTAI